MSDSSPKAPSEPPPPAPRPPEAAPRRARLERELIVLAYLVVVIFAVRGFVDPDLPGHIAYGRDHLATGQLPAKDPYSYSVGPNDVWVNHEVLFELVVGWVFNLLGPIGPVLLQLFAWSLAGFLILRLCRRATPVLLARIVAFLGFVMLAYPAMTCRPQLFTYMMFAILLTCLEAGRGGRLWAFLGAALLFFPWVNMHGGFLAGLGIFGVYVIGLILDAALKRAPRGDQEQPPVSAWKTAIAAGGAGLLAIGLTFLNAYGPHLHLWMLKSLGRPRPMISEWRSVELDLQGVLFLLFLAFTAWALIARGRREGWSRTPLAHVLVLGITAYLGVRHIRHIPFFGMVTAAFAAGAFGDLYRARVAPHEGDIEPKQLRGMRVLYALVLVPSIALSLSWPRTDPFSLRLWGTGEDPWPTGAVKYMDEHDVRGNLVVYFDWAQLMIWRYYPKVRVFYDGRFRTVYNQTLEDDYFTFLNEEASPGWTNCLENYPTTMVLMPTGMGTTERLRKLPGWRIAFEDTACVLFFKKQPGEGEIPTVHGAHPPPILPFRPEDSGQHTGR